MAGSKSSLLVIVMVYELRIVLPFKMLENKKYFVTHKNNIKLIFCTCKIIFIELYKDYHLCIIYDFIITEHHACSSQSF